MEPNPSDSRRSTSSLACDAQDLLDQASERLVAGFPHEAVEQLRRARERAPDDAGIQSLLGLALARSGGPFDEARALCEDASRREFDNPDLYVHLACVYLSVGRRPEALRYLRRGQMVDPHHARISQMLEELGRRRPAVIGFLPRRHWLNRALGSLRGLVSRFGPFRVSSPPGARVGTGS